MKLRFLFGLLALFLLFVASSCSMERKLAQEFVKQSDSISVLLLPPDFVFKTNLNSWTIENFDEFSGQEQDKMLIDSSVFLQYVNDTVLRSRFISSLESKLRKFGIFVYSPDEIVEFLDVKNTAYQITIAQLELEEDIYPYRAEEIYDTLLFYEDFDLDKVSFNTWFEISKLNDHLAVNNVLYASDFITEELEGRFTSNVFTGEVKFKYNIYPLKLEDVYTLVAKLGERYAAYIYDYIMNQYIYFKFPEGKQPKVFLTYDHDAGVLGLAGEERFLFLDE